MSQKNVFISKLLFVIGGLFSLLVLFLAWKAWNWGYEGDSMGCSTCIIFGFLGAVFILSFLIPLFILMRNLNNHFQRESSEPTSKEDDEDQSDIAVSHNNSLTDLFLRPLQLVFSVFSGIGAAMFMFFIAELLNRYFDESRSLWFLTPFVFFGIIWWLLHIHGNIHCRKNRLLSVLIVKRLIQIILFVFSGIGIAYFCAIAFQMLSLRTLLNFRLQGYFWYIQCGIVSVVTLWLIARHAKNENKLVYLIICIMIFLIPTVYVYNIRSHDYAVYRRANINADSNGSSTAEDSYGNRLTSPDVNRLLKFNGVYQAEGDLPDSRHWNYLRFYSHNNVISVVTSGTPEDLSQWFSEDNEFLAHGEFSITGTTIEFSTSSNDGVVDYHGSIEGESLRLTVFNQANDEQSIRIYHFVPVEFDK